MIGSAGYVATDRDGLGDSGSDAFVLAPGVGVLAYLLFGRNRKAFSRQSKLLRQDLEANARGKEVVVLTHQPMNVPFGSPSLRIFTSWPMSTSMWLSGSSPAQAAIALSRPT